MMSRIPESLARRLPQRSDMLQSLLVIVMLATIVGLYFMTNISLGSAAIGSASSKRDGAIEKAKEYIEDNFHGLASVELESESVQEEDGVWKVVFKCVKHPAGARGAGGERVTLRLFVHEGSLQVSGLSTDGW